MIEDNTHTDDFKRKTHCANVGIRQKLIVRILEFYKNSVSKFLENKKLNVLDMGYTLKHTKNTQTAWESLILGGAYGS